MSQTKLSTTDIQAQIHLLTRIVNGCAERLAAGPDHDLELLATQAKAALDRLSGARQRKLAAVAEYQEANLALSKTYQDVSDETARMRARLHARFGQYNASDLAAFGIRARSRTRPRKKA